MSLDAGFDAQTPSLPSGGGAATGIGETFTPDLSTGTGTYHIPLDVPNGPNDIAPRLGLHYDTAFGNGAFGMGFALPLTRIVRSTAQGFPHYDQRDSLMLEGAGEMLAIGPGRYRLQVDGGLWQVEADGDGFRLTDRAGVRSYLGADETSRLTGVDGAGATVTYAWHLARTEDALGNVARFTWQRDQNQLYLAKVAYGAYELRFGYEARPDPQHSGRAGFLVTTGLRCTAIELHLTTDASSLVRRWGLRYTQAPTNGASLLSTLSLAAFGADGTHLDAPPLQLGYSPVAIRDLVRFGAVDDGITPGPLTRPDHRVELVDWLGRGLPDLLEISPGGHARRWPNLGDCTWGRPVAIGDLPWFGGPMAGVGLVDLNGDGVADLIRTDRPLDGYLPRILGGGFDRPVTWRASPRVAPDHPGVRLVDLDGDGRVDLMASGAENLLLYYRDDPDGWGSPQVVPRAAAPATDLSDAHVFLADMTGDGSADVVRVDGGGVTYWPYLGLGHWADPVRMDNPPSLPFDVEAGRLYLNDVDGDGCADLVYISGGKVFYWFNQGGNRFSDQHTIDWLPTGRMSEVRLVDMRGTGTAGILWAQPGPFGHLTTYFYLDFTGATKPYLLNRIDNSIGLVTQVSYTTSALEAARAARDGDPWSTALPVVVPVVAEVAVADATSGAVRTVRYQYRDGRWDGRLREFAGFAEVHQDELGDAEQPTLRTSVLFHVGLDPSTGAEPVDDRQRRSWRSLRGRIRSQGRYGPDGGAQAAFPFDRVEHDWIVVQDITPAGPVDIPRLRTTTTTIFERSPTASSVVANTSLAWDPLGNVTESAETSMSPLDPTFTRTLRTKTHYAKDPAGRFIAKPWRIQQFDGAGLIIADTVLEYDHAPEGGVGSQGLVTMRSALVLSDTTVADVYGASLPDFASLGYFRRADSPGWWVTMASYQRSEDASGLRGRVTGPLGAETEITFDPLRQFPVRFASPYGNVVRATYDPRLARPTEITDTAGATQHTTYDALARVTSSIAPGDSDAFPTTSYRYAVSTLPVEVNRAQRAEKGVAATINTRIFVDGAGRTLEERAQDELGEIAMASFRYGARGLLARRYPERRVTSITYQAPPEGDPALAFSYDALGRIVRSVNVDGSVTTVAYRAGVVDEADEEDTRTGAGATHAGTYTSRHIDASGRISAVEQRLGARSIVSTYQFDTKGNLIRHVDPLGRVVSTTYDHFGRILRAQRPEQTSVTVHDAAGNPVESRVGDRRVTRKFDLRNRPIEERHDDAGAGPAVTFTYHDPGRPAPADAGTNTLGRLARVDDRAGSAIFDYDQRGNAVTRIWMPPGGARRFRVDIDYRSDGQAAQVQFPDGGSGRQTFTNTYDLRGRLSSIPGVVDQIGYDVGSRRTQVKYSNGVTWSGAYDGRGRPVSAQLEATAGVVWSARYTLDRVGNVVAIDSPDVKVAAHYAYDDLYRLTDATLATGEAFSYSFDDAGNLTRKSDVGDYRYGENGFSATCVTTAGSGQYTYTAAGQIHAAPWGTHVWDPLGRLLQLSTATGVIDYSYDYLGRRVGAQSQGSAGAALVTPDPLYSIEGGVVVLHIGGFARQVSGGKRTYLHTDHLGGLIRVTDETGSVVESRRYDPYGRTLEHSGTLTPNGFATGVPEERSGLILFGARYYHPVLGRFLSPDDTVANPFEPINWASYTYCHGNPTSLIDPDGHNPWRIIITVIAAVALVALTIVTWGAAAPLAAAVIIGAIAGGIVGGVTAGRQKGADGWDVVSGIIVGAAVGGWSAYVGSSAYGAIIKGLGQGVWQGAIAGGVSGTINGAAMGFTAGFAGRADAVKTLELMAAGAAVGLAFGAVLGALTGGVQSGKIKEPTGKETIGAKVQDLQNQYTNRSAQVMENEAIGKGTTVGVGETGPAAQSGTAGKVFGTAGGQVANAVAPTAEYEGGLAGRLDWVRVLATDVPSGTVVVFADDLARLQKEGKIPEFVFPFSF